MGVVAMGLAAWAAEVTVRAVVGTVGWAMEDEGTVMGWD